MNITKMPQEVRILQCSECKLFQVDLVKKTNKWTCKMCNVKQVLRNEYFRGTGSECRAKVQKLNKEQALDGSNASKNALEKVDKSQYVEQISNVKHTPVCKKSSTEVEPKWSFSQHIQSPISGIDKFGTILRNTYSEKMLQNDTSDRITKQIKENGSPQPVLF
ncbi:MRN complex-interacting protein isoform X2 [Ceratitis capitata]|uniref:MRN complex-interacting protein isoform X2 n=1 Tax=Ceratitis capitata TaxID=7213 RepID=UPI000A0FEE54|nr:MRN complex-interacting protein isoform X2 [Ceratitis capitata]